LAVIRPDGLQDSLTEERFTPRLIPTEEQLSRQEERIAYLRSSGQPWAEAVFQLRDMLVGFEDDEFWDGLPGPVRKGLSDQTDDDKAETLTEWASEGWLNFPCRAIRGRGGEPVYRPTPEDLSHAYRILRRLMDRSGFIRKTRRTSRLTARPTTNEVPQEVEA
jgi:hypothetical protein